MGEKGICSTHEGESKTLNDVMMWSRKFTYIALEKDMWEERKKERLPWKTPCETSERKGE